MLVLIFRLPYSDAAMATSREAGSAMRRRDVLKGATAAAALAQQPSAALARVPASAWRCRATRVGAARSSSSPDGNKHISHGILVMAC